MEVDFMQNLVNQAPSFVGFIVAVIVLSRELSEARKMLRECLQFWRECEQDRERSKILEKD